MSITIVGDNLIHYEAVGRGEPLVFIHGWLGSWRYWWSSMQAMSRHYRTFAFDLWGFGDSSKVKEKYTFNDYVNMLRDFVNQLGIAEPATLVGHSLGAAVGLRYARQNPQNVKRLVAVSLPVVGDYIHDRLSNTNCSTFVNKVLGKSNTHPEIESELRKTDEIAMNQLAGELSTYNFADDLINLSCPVLLVFGSQDPVVQQPSGDYYHFQQPSHNRAYVALDSCYHFPMLEERVKFNRLILDFAHSQNDFKDLAPKDYWQRRTH
jgi:pimeloyl-ACP methyl ester carboxylesterase